MQPALRPVSFFLCDIYPNEVSHGYQQVTLSNATEMEKDELLMLSDFFCGFQHVSLCWGRRCSPAVFMCAVCSHRVTLACQSIKWRGPVSHQGAERDYQCLDAQKFAPPRSKSPLREKGSSVTQAAVPIQNDRCAVWLKCMTALYTRLNTKYMHGHWHTAKFKLLVYMLVLAHWYMTTYYSLYA